DYPVLPGEGVDLRVPVFEAAGPAVDQHHGLRVFRTVRVHTQPGSVGGPHIDDLMFRARRVERGVAVSAAAAQAGPVHLEDPIQLMGEGVPELRHHRTHRHSFVLLTDTVTRRSEPRQPATYQRGPR